RRLRLHCINLKLAYLPNKLDALKPIEGYLSDAKHDIDQFIEKIRTKMRAKISQFHKAHFMVCYLEQKLGGFYSQSSQDELLNKQQQQIQTFYMRVQKQLEDAQNMNRKFDYFV